VKPTIAVMLGGSGGKAGAGHGHSEPDDGDTDTSDSTDEAVEEELGTAVAEALSAKDPVALYRAICDIVKYENGG
jgi:hypothetical protein